MSSCPRASILARHAVTVRGQGPRTLVLAHGFGCDQSAWSRLIPHFEADWRVVSFDHIGAGDSDLLAYDPDRHGSLYGHAQDMLDIAQALALEGAVLVGHSASAMAGLLATLQAPGRFSHLAMIGPSPRYLNEPALDGRPAYVGGFERPDLDEMFDLMEINFEAFAQAMVPLALHQPQRPDLAQELGLSFGRMDPRIGRRWARAIFLSDHRDALPRVAVPTLVLQCRDDALAPQPVAEMMVARMPGSTLHMLPASGHFPHLSHADEVAAALRDWLSRQGC
ncbi:alpha/beta fold hydrolase [Ideonella livida]|uniref:Alpha/beta hydrolase n=1 Tax=Ideonella livida TaxID=2707176 RepID=A0A7C9PJY8_9BURK|nr:alpha/beta hydrolase [Ideonella livida]NDY92912.1 alpha/beta hydrolase [Ideonella livida]